MKERRGILMVVCVAAVLCLGVLVWLLRHPSANGRGGIAITFAGYGKVTGTNMACFRVTNQCNVPIGLLFGPAQIKFASGWPKLGLFTNFAAIAVLDPDQGTTFRCPPPTNDGDWRVPIVYFRRKSALGWAIEKHVNLPVVRRSRILDVRGPFCPTNSPAVTEVPVSPAEANNSGAGN